MNWDEITWQMLDKISELAQQVGKSDLAREEAIRSLDRERSNWLKERMKLEDKVAVAQKERDAAREEAGKC